MVKQKSSKKQPQDPLRLVGEAIIILSLPSALPIPTAGIAHSLSIIIIIFAFWGLILSGVTPKQQRRFEAGREKVLRFERLRKLHNGLWNHAGKLLRERNAYLFKNKSFQVLTGALIILCAICFFTILPVGDTPPSLAVIFFGFSLVYKDISAWFAGVIMGILGVAINFGTLVFVATKIIEFISHRL